MEKIFIYQQSDNQNEKNEKVVLNKIIQNKIIFRILMKSWPKRHSAQLNESCRQIKQILRQWVEIHVHSLYRGCTLAVRLFSSHFFEQIPNFSDLSWKNLILGVKMRIYLSYTKTWLLSTFTEILEKYDNFGTNNLACTSKKSWNRTTTTFQFNATKDRREFIGNYAEFDEPESSEAWCNKLFSIVFIVSLFSGFRFQLDFSISSLKPFFILLSKVT